MKKLGFLLIAAMTLFSCEPEHPQEYLSISGTLKNSNDSIFYITGFGIRKRIKILEDGSFQDSMKVVKPDLYTFGVPKHGRAYIFLKNGYDLKLEGDANNLLSSFTYQGSSEAAQSNNFLVDQFNFGQTAGNARGFLILEKEEFQNKIAFFRKGIDSIKELYPKANEQIVQNIDTQTSSFLKQMEDSYDQMHPVFVQQQKAMEKLEKGKPAPEFHNYEDYQGGTKSLKDFRGNFVYIDVWATWCKPCLAQIPFSKQLEKEFEGKNIKFVAISTDDQRRSGGSWEKAHQKWKDMVKAKDLTGVQLWAGKDDARFSTEYMIQGIPRYILIDPEGNIVNANEMRPSDPRISDYFTSLGIK